MATLVERIAALAQAVAAQFKALPSRFHPLNTTINLNGTAGEANPWRVTLAADHVAYQYTNADAIGIYSSKYGGIVTFNYKTSVATVFGRELWDKTNLDPSIYAPRNGPTFQDYVNISAGYPVIYMIDTRTDVSNTAKLGRIGYVNNTFEFQKLDASYNFISLPLVIGTNDVAYFSQRPSFGAWTPWDSGNLPRPVSLDPGRYVDDLVRVLSTGALTSDPFVNNKLEITGDSSVTNGAATITFHIGGVVVRKFGMNRSGDFGWGSSDGSNAYFWDSVKLPSPVGKDTNGNLTAPFRSYGARKTIATANYGEEGLLVDSASGGDDPHIILNRYGLFGVNFGLDADNALAFGGISEGAVSYKIWTQKSLKNPLSRADGSNYINGPTTFPSSGKLNSGSFSQTLELKGYGTNDRPGMLVHWAGVYATYWGMDDDQDFAHGGFSDGTNIYKFWTSKNTPKATAADIAAGTSTRAIPSVADTKTLVRAITDPIAEITGRSIVQYGADKTGVISSGTAFNNNTSDATSIVVPPGTYLISESITLRGLLKFAKGAVLKPANGVTIYCQDLEIEAGFYQIFDLSLGGKIISGTNSLRVRYINVDWFGAKIGNTSDQSVFFQQAILFAETCGGSVFIRVGRWRLDNPLYIRNMCTLQGVRCPMIVDPAYPWVSILDFSATTNNGIVVNPDAQGILNGAYIYDLAIIGSGSRGSLPSNGVGIDFRGVYSGKINRCSVSNFNINICIDDCATNPSIHCEVIDCTIGNPRAVSLEIGGCTTLLVDRCMISGRDHIVAPDFTVSDDPEIIDTVIMISGAHRGQGNPTCDTINFTNCILGTRSRSNNIVTIRAGMYMSFRNCDMESALNAGVSLQFSTDADPSINVVTCYDVWWNDVKTCFQSVNRLRSFRIESCRLDNSYGDTAVYVANPQNQSQDVDVIISNSNIICRKANGSGILLVNARGASITNNRIRMLNDSTNSPAITIAGETNIVAQNRLTTNYNDGNNLNGVNNGGTNNLVVNNIRVAY